jgi:CheY-like chemotaxis protein
MQRRSILVVDDEPFIVDELVEAISFEGYECLSAHSADDALEVMSQTDSIQVALSDVQMPDKSGLDLLQEARVRFSNPPTFIMMSGHTDAEFEATCLEAGAFSMLRKPIEIELLFSVLQQAMDA